MTSNTQDKMISILRAFLGDLGRFASKWTNYPFWALIVACGLAAASCGQIKYVPVETTTTTITNYRDSLRIKDSIRVIPIERYVDIVRPLDTLHLETSLAAATAYFDTTFNALRGEIHNKREIEEHHREVEHSTAKADTVYVDKKVPYPVEVEKKVVPRWCWWSLVFNILGIAITGFLIYLKIKKR